MVFGVICALLGGLWLLQGLGIVHVRPILCFAGCAAIQGLSPAWAVIGAVTLAISVLLLFWSLKRQQDVLFETNALADQLDSKGKTKS